MDPKLDKSVPKDQIAMLALATSIGIVAGLLTLRWWSRAPDVTLFVVAYMIFGAVLGAFDIGFPRRRKLWLGWLGWAVVAVIIPVLFFTVPTSMQLFREIFPGIVAWITASFVIGIYHFACALRARTGSC